MSLLIESIRLENGSFANLFYHEQRMKKSLQEVCGVDEDVNLEKFLSEIDAPSQGLFKCRIVYDENSKTVEFNPYQQRPINSLKVVESERISYSHKFLDRTKIDKLFEKRDGCDDILIIKKGLVTDSSYANIVFRKGKTWYTPWSPLLPGTMRQQLIEDNKIVPEQISVEDISSFKVFRLINAMLRFESDEIPVSNITF